jgi:hypothetical protein
LSWNLVLRELWAMTPDLNESRPDDHPFSMSPITRLRRGGAISCQHALFLLRWLEAPPERFVVGAPAVRDASLPASGPGRRLRWSLRRLYDALDAERRARQLTWSELATVLGCSPSQLTGLRTARYATGMGLAMRITGWLGRPAADFIYAAKW